MPVHERPRRTGAGHHAAVVTSAARRPGRPPVPDSRRSLTRAADLSTSPSCPQGLRERPRIYAMVGEADRAPVGVPPRQVGDSPCPSRPSTRPSPPLRPSRSPPNIPPRPPVRTRSANSPCRPFPPRTPRPATRCPSSHPCWPVEAAVDFGFAGSYAGVGAGWRPVSPRLLPLWRSPRPTALRDRRPSHHHDRIHRLPFTARRARSSSGPRSGSPTPPSPGCCTRATAWTCWPPTASWPRQRKSSPYRRRRPSPCPPCPRMTVARPRAL